MQKLLTVKLRYNGLGYNGPSLSMDYFIGPGLITINVHVFIVGYNGLG